MTLLYLKTRYMIKTVNVIGREKLLKTIVDPLHRISISESPIFTYKRVFSFMSALRAKPRDRFGLEGKHTNKRRSMACKGYIQ